MRCSRRIDSGEAVTRRIAMSVARARDRRNIRLRIAALLSNLPAADRANILSGLLADAAPIESARLGAAVRLPCGALFFPVVTQ